MNSGQLKLEAYQRFINLIMPIIIAFATWYISGVNSAISNVSKELNQMNVQYTVLLTKLETFERLQKKSDTSIDLLIQRVSVLEASEERISENLRNLSRQLEKVERGER